MPARVTIRTRTNADWARAFIYREKNSGPRIPLAVNGTPVVLKLNVRRTPEAAEAIAITSQGAQGITITDHDLGAFAVRFTRAQLTMLGKGEFVHDLIGTWPDGHTETIWTGTLENEIGVTRT
jgi:hypothetical protein